MRGAPVTYLDFSGGRNTQNADYLLSETENRDQLNVHTSLSGDISKRNGFVTFSGATLTGEPVKATSVHTLFPSNAATKSLLGVATTATTDTIFKLTTGAIASVLKTGLTANTRWYWAQADVSGGEGPLFGMNGVDTPQRWNGSAGATSDWVATTGTVPKAGKYLIYHMSRLWCAEGSRLRYSGLTGSTPDPLSWPADNYVDFDPNDGQEIRGINKVGDYLIVAKARKTYKVYDLITGANQLISSEIGTVAHRSMVETPIGLLFLSENQGICVCNGENVKPFSDQIQPDLVKATATPETMSKAAATLDGRRYQLSISLEGSRNDHTIEYDLIKKSWWLHTCASNQFALLDPGGSPVLYSADSTTSARVSKAFVTNTYADNGAVYKGGSYWVSPWRAYGIGGRGLNPHVTKRITEIRVDGVGNWAAAIATNFDEEFEVMEGEIWEAANEPAETTFAGSGTFAGEGVFGASESADTTRHYLTPALGRAFSVKFSDETEQNFTIRSATFLITPRSN